jgi:hypothetical protein
VASACSSVEVRPTGDAAAGGALRRRRARSTGPLDASESRSSSSRTSQDGGRLEAARRSDRCRPRGGRRVSADASQTSGGEPGLHGPCAAGASGPRAAQRHRARGLVGREEPRSEAIHDGSPQSLVPGPWPSRERRVGQPGTREQGPRTALRRNPSPSDFFARPLRHRRPRPIGRPLPRLGRVGGARLLAGPAAVPDRGGGAPYGGASAFAGNALLISPEILLQDGFLRFRPSRTSRLFRRIGWTSTP